MKADLDNLPKDPDELQAIVRSLMSVNDSPSKNNSQLEGQVNSLESRVDSLESELCLHRIKCFQSTY